QPLGHGPAKPPGASCHERYLSAQPHRSRATSWRKAWNVPSDSTLKSFASRSIRLINPERTRPGPTSTKRVAPSATMLRTDSSQRTGALTCRARQALISSGVVTGAAVTLLYTGNFGGAMGIDASHS